MSQRPAALFAILLASAAAPAPAADPKTDLYGDPLPDGAVARLGTARMRFPAGGLVFLPPDYTTFLATGDGDRVRRFDAATGKPVDGEGFRGFVLGVSADGTRAAVAGEKVAVLEVATGRVVHRVDGWGGRESVSLSADGKKLAVVRRTPSGKSEVVVWDVDGQKIAAVIDPDVGDLPTLTLAPDGATVVIRTGLGGAPLAVWDVAAGKERFRVPTGAAAVPAVAYEANGATLAVGDGDGAVDVWDVREGRPLFTLPGLPGQGAAVAFAADGGAVVAVSADGTVQRWGPDGRLLDTTRRPAGSALFSPPSVGAAAGGRVVVWGPVGHTWAAWEAPARKWVTPGGASGAAVTGIGFPAGGREVWAANGEGRVSRWEAATGKRVGAQAAADGPGRPGLYGRPRVLLAADAGRGLIPGYGREVFDPATGEPLFVLPRPTGGENGDILVLPSQGLTLAASVRPSVGPGKSGRCDIWDLTLPRRVGGFDLPAGFGVPLVGGGMAADGKRLVLIVPSEDPATKVLGQALAGWEPEGVKKVGEVRLPPNQAHGVVAVIGDVAVLATANRLWAVDYVAGRVLGDVDVYPDAPAGAQRGMPQPQPGGRWGSPPAAVGPGGAWFAAAVPVRLPGGYGVRVYGWPEGKVLRTLAGHTEPVTAVAVSPDGKTLATGSEDTTVLLWDVSDLGGKK